MEHTKDEVKKQIKRFLEILKRMNGYEFKSIF